MDKKDKKRDVAVFANMMKDLMNEPLDNVLTTLDRDIQHFIYGRISVLVKHNDGKPLGSLADMGAVVGAATADVIKEIVRQLDGEKQVQALSTVRENLLKGFDIRSPKAEESVEEVTEETAQ